MASIFQTPYSDDFCNDNICISIKISLKYDLMGLINNIPAFVQIMAGADQATSHHTNQMGLDNCRIMRNSWMS